VYRYRRDTYTDTPLPPEEPAGKNPPDGAIIDYFLNSPADDLKLEILDSNNQVVRTFPNDDRPAPTPKQLHVPTYWLRPPEKLNNTAGMHRFVWDLHYTPPGVLQRDYPISAIYYDTPLSPQGIFAPPGRYTVRLTAAGKQYSEPLVIKADPRVKIPHSDYDQQYGVEKKLITALHQDYTALQQVRSLRAQLKDLKSRAQGTLAQSISTLDQEAAGAEGVRGGFGGGSQSSGLARLNGSLAHVYEIVSAADAAPTTQAVAAADQLQHDLAISLSRWEEVKRGVDPLNQKLQSAGLPAIDLRKTVPSESEPAEEDEP
jgi:hypothetical protein